ncbi:MAG: ABC transporter permease [Verrucomicrobia bacterium]|nr:ABC transporter permease [Verrucomicrobiota bacterium]
MTTSPGGPVSDASAPPPDAADLVYASQWKLMGRRFCKHKLALVGTGILLVFYVVAAFCEFFAPNDPTERDATLILAPPQSIRFVDEEGKFHFRPFVYGYRMEVNPETWQRVYTPDPEKRYDLVFFPKGEPYRLWNLIPMQRRLFGSTEGRVLLLGTDTLGRDVLSRIMFGARISLTIGLIGVVLTFCIGITLGGIAGYFGGFTDHAIQRLIEVLICIPQLPLWMVLSAALPGHWSALRMYFGITLILSFLGWTGLARVVRGKFLSLRNEDFVVAARLSGTGEVQIIFRHMVPSFMSHIIASATLAVPGMILGETALSFLGIGLRPPVISWGVLLQQAQNFQSVAMAPWLLYPGLFVIIVVLAFNVVGDGLRDAADPYAE